MAMTQPSMTLARGRLLIVLAAVLWSLSGAGVKLLTTPTGLGDLFHLPDPPMPGLLIAFYRPLWAGIVLLPLLRAGDFKFHPLFLLMLPTFAVMNLLFVLAQALGSAANAIVLQYTAPVWMYLGTVFWLREPTDRRDPSTLLIAMLGVAVILVDAVLRPTPETLWAVLIALGSGITYAGVLLCLRVLRGLPAPWLTVLNHAAAALLLLPFIVPLSQPTWPQLGFMVAFGAIQMGLPYLLMARGLRVVSAQEAGMICLLEPLLNPLWAYLAAGDVPDSATVIGGSIILAALAWRYAPRGMFGKGLR
jgi:drug/metabolite transporter (DMT)-like permease